jgi:hypothetical protein
VVAEAVAETQVMVYLGVAVAGVQELAVLVALVHLVKVTLAVLVILMVAVAVVQVLLVMQLLLLLEVLVVLAFHRQYQEQLHTMLVAVVVLVHQDRLLVV